MQHVTRLAAACPSTIGGCIPAREFLADTYTPLLNGVWMSQVGYGNTSIPIGDMVDFVRLEAYAQREWNGTKAAAWQLGMGMPQRVVALSLYWCVVEICLHCVCCCWLWPVTWICSMCGSRVWTVKLGGTRTSTLTFLLWCNAAPSERSLRSATSTTNAATLPPSADHARIASASPGRVGIAWSLEAGADHDSEVQLAAAIASAFHRAYDVNGTPVAACGGDLTGCACKLAAAVPNPSWAGFDVW